MAKKKEKEVKPPGPPTKELTLTELRIKSLYEDLKVKAYNNYKEGNFKESGAYNYCVKKLLEIIETF